MQRKTYVASLVDVRRPELLHFRKSYFKRYHLKVNGRRLRVCRPMFQSTLGIKYRYIFKCTTGKQQETKNVCVSGTMFPSPTEVVLKASLCSDLSKFVASTESQWFGV